MPALRSIYESHASLQDRVVGTGFLDPALAARFAPAASSDAGRAGAFDARLAPGYAPYDMLAPAVVVEAGGDVDARVRVRVAELTRLDRPGAAAARGPARGRDHGPPARRAGEGVGLVEGFRGECLTWLGSTMAG
jgi:Ni,Fe-hydrogenase III large subunit